MTQQILPGWGTCLDCGYEGVLEFHGVPGEHYEDPEALGVMMLLHCPACESREHTLIPMEYYRELAEGPERGE